MGQKIDASYRLGFAVKVLGEGGLPSADTRRWQSGPHLSRSLELLDAVFDYLDRIGVRVYRLGGSTIPYGTHPALPQLDHRRQLDECADALAALGDKARRLGLRLSTHPGQYTVLNSPDKEIAAKAALDLEQDAALLDALGQGTEAVVVVHVGGVYGDRASALDRWAGAYERLSDAARRRVVLEHDERCFSLADVLGLHDRTGVRVVYDLHHDRCKPSDATAADALATWNGVRPKVHLSSARLDGTRLEPHADYVAPWDLAQLLASVTRPVDVVLEAKAKDLAVLALRRALERTAPELATAEERG